MKPAESTSSLYSNSPDAPCTEIFKVGDQVKKGELNGRVAYVGKTEFDNNGQWIGIILERPEGKNNGTVKGKTYFKCADKYGLFCRANALTKMGDSPKRAQRLGSPTPSYAGSMAPSIAASQMGKEHSLYSAEYGYDLGQTVETSNGHAGKVKFLDMLNGQVFVGILFTKPVGDSDGKFQGIKYFSSYPKYATFLPADQVKLKTNTNAALPPKTAPRETKASLLRKEKRADGAGTIVSSWRGSQESLNSQRSPRSPPPKTGLKRQPNPMKDNEMIAGLKKDLQEKIGHLTNMSNELEEYRFESVRLTDENSGLRNENRSLKLRVGELDTKINELTKEINKTQADYDDRSFCCTELEVRNEELEMKLSELQAKHLEPLIELDEEPMDGKEEEKICLEMSTQTDPIPAPKPNEKSTACSQTDPRPEPPKRMEMSMQTDPIPAPKSVTKLEMATQTDPIPAPKLPEKFAASVQTDQGPAATKAEMSTQTDPIPAPKPIEKSTTCSQTDPDPEPPKRMEMSIQTDPIPAPKLPERLAAFSQTDQIPSPTKAEMSIQTDSAEQMEMSSQTDPIPTSKSPERMIASYKNEPRTPEKVGGGGVLELNVTNLSKDADQFSHLPSTSGGQHSPNTWQRKYDSKCQDYEALERTKKFLDSIIADQGEKIEELKKLTAEMNGNRISSASIQETPPPPPPKRKPPTRRVYCNHCEVFDLHETDDCPKLEAQIADMMAHSAISPKKEEIQQ